MTNRAGIRTQIPWTPWSQPLTIGSFWTLTQKIIFVCGLKVTHKNENEAQLQLHWVNYQKHGVPCEWRFGDKSNPTAIHRKLVSAHLILTAVNIQLAEYGIIDENCHYSTFITLSVALLLSCWCFKSDLISEASTEFSVRVCTVSWWVGSCLFFFVGADNFAIHTEIWIWIWTLVVFIILIISKYIRYFARVAIQVAIQP